MRLPDEPKFSGSQIQSRINELATTLNHDLEKMNPLFLITLKGAIHFGSDLLRKITISHELDFIQAKSYEDTQSTGTIGILKEPTTPLDGRVPVLLEDIVDTGLTAHSLEDWCRQQGAKDFLCCTLLNKPANRKIEFEPNYVGYEVGKNEFVVGYGMDYNEEYRSLPEIYVLETSSPD